MDSIFDTGMTTMINLRGRLTTVQAGEVALRKAEGWKIVVNPKRNYWPEYDMQNKNKLIQSTDEVDDDLENSDILKFEYV